MNSLIDISSMASITNLLFCWEENCMYCNGNNWKIETLYNLFL